MQEIYKVCVRCGLQHRGQIEIANIWKQSISKIPRSKAGETGEKFRVSHSEELRDTRVVQ
jgi:hypothetical protein